MLIQLNKQPFQLQSVGIASLMGLIKKLKIISNNEPKMVAPTIPAIPNVDPTEIAG